MTEIEAAPSVARGVEDYGDAQAEYLALRHHGAHEPIGGAIVVDRSTRGRMTLHGARAREVLTGLVTNDVLSLEPGRGCYAAALTAKGKLVTDLRILARVDDVLVDTPARGFAAWWALVRKFVNPRLARYEDLSERMSELGVFGTRAHAALAAMLEIGWEELTSLEPFEHRTTMWRGHEVVVARVPDLGLEGFSLFLPSDARSEAWDALVKAGVRPAGIRAFDIARLEAGRGEFGVELDDATLAQEANLDELHAISYTKGCYTGQETVARVHFRGHVNRYLRGLRLSDERPVPVRAEVRDRSGKVVGDVRSMVVSPRLGGIALAMVRREVPDGGDVEVVWGDGEGDRGRARVVALPFESSGASPEPERAGAS